MNRPIHPRDDRLIWLAAGIVACFAAAAAVRVGVELSFGRWMVLERFGGP